MIYAIVYLIAFMVFLSAPLPLQIIFMIVNFFIPDPIPIIDEAFMTVSILKKIALFGRAADFADEHPNLVKVIILSTVIIAGILIKYLLFS